MFRSVDGTILRVRHREAEGQAPHLMFLHALGTGIWAWEEVAARLPSAWGFTLPELRGHGLSGGAADDMDDFARDALALAPDRAWFAGLSIGGQIAIRAACLGPDRVAGLILADTAARIGSEAYYAARAERVRAEGMDPVAAEQIERWFAPEFARRAPEIVAGARHALARQPVDGYLAACRALGRTDLSGVLAQVTCPALCIGGAEDVSTTPEAMAALADGLPAGSHAVIDGAGHLPPVERPEEMTRRIIEYVAAHHPPIP
ncbi:alpha/beta hydrolase [Jannaschia sp. S6380]|uniref:alpha/beta fold hydrolase n=1 Tax=Jannaschia sp. S6380 TaxID=2926408 RepID=UPI001FF48A92|nr:alpha/beta fold hydrolase [Jannaschia sp. S6380]MCK0167221.1 alpha/beta hydrolase [Jannaschia sp. S6380]